MKHVDPRANVAASHILLPENPAFTPLLNEPETAAQARLMSARFRLEQAVDHGVALMAALGLPPIAGDVLAEAVDLLDTIDSPTEDMEPEDDHRDLLDDGEDDESEREGDWSDYEPSLGSLGGTAATVWLGQRHWSGGGRQDFEEQDEDGGDINDEPHDEDPHEPSLGSLDRRMDQRGWAGDSSIASWTDAEGDDADAENCCRTWPRTEAEVVSHTFHPVARRARIIDLPRPGDFGQGEARRLGVDAPRRRRGYDRTYTQCGVRVVGSVR